MRIILSRHGNTFNSSAEAYWVGGANDLPLVEEGRNQAKCCGQALKKAGIELDGIYCAPLKRTREYAEIIVSEIGMNIEPIIDERLREIDYGNWAGKSNDEIIELYGRQEVEEWQKYSKWPMSGNWLPGEKKIASAIKSLAMKIVENHKENDNVMVVSSNGILRYFLKLVPGEFDRRVNEQTLKVKTGNLCVISYSGSAFLVDFWNRNPADL